MWTLLTLTIVLFHAQSGVANNPVPEFVQCGGTVEADTGFLTFPEVNQTLTPGEICIWTIHLETLIGFSFSFSQFDITSKRNIDCKNAGIKFYSLNSVFIGDKPESYTFCNEKPPLPSFFMGQSIIAIIFYSTDPTSGFTLTWKGASFDSSTTKHISSILRASGAPIMYPVIGSYEENLAATWLVKANDVAAVDINFHFLDVQYCAAVNPCFCDALFLYELETSSSQEPPFLVLSSKFCTNLTSPVKVENVNSRFILALFTDRNGADSDFGRFSLTYYPAQYQITTTEPTTTTTELTTTTIEPSTTPYIKTTTDPNFSESTQCGETLDNKRGRIAYKVNQDVVAGERCIWVIRARKSIEITFRLVESGLSTDTESIDISSFRNLERGHNNDPDPTDAYFHRKANMKRNGTTFTIIGSTAIVLFSTVEANGQGFILDFEGDEVSDSDVAATQSSDNMLEGISGSFKFPENGGNYANLELSTFVFRPPNDVAQGDSLVIKLSTNSGSAMENCYDSLRVFNFNVGNDGFEQHKRICENDFNPDTDYTTDSTCVLLFLSDNDFNYAGFTINWNYQSRVDGDMNATVF